MVGAKEIRTKMSSIKNTQKITKAMEMVAVSKMRKTQDRLIASLPYSNSMNKVINHLLSGNLEHKHPYLRQRKIKNIGYLIISTDRGLCGGLNINLFKKILIHMKSYVDQDIKIKLAIIGYKGISFFNNISCNIIAHATALGDKPILSDLIGTIRVMLQEYDNYSIDKLYIANNKFKTIVSQIPTITQLLPLYTQTQKEKVTFHNWDYIYEPDSKALLNTLLVRYIESQVYQGVLDNLASEQAARMLAMKSASDNCGNLLTDLQLIYNKARQASITQELIEIISGAAVV